MKTLEAPRFLPNDIVFAIPDNMHGFNGFNYFGEYKISKVEIVPDCFIYNPNTGKHEASDEKKYVYYGRVKAGFDIELMHVFKNKDEFLKFMSEYQFHLHSPT